MDAGQFQCPECSQEFETQDELDQHIEELHPMAPVPGDETVDRPEDAGRSPDDDSEPGDINQRHQY